MSPFQLKGRVRQEQGRLPSEMQEEDSVLQILRATQPKSGVVLVGVQVRDDDPTFASPPEMFEIACGLMATSLGACSSDEIAAFATVLGVPVTSLVQIRDVGLRDLLEAGPWLAPVAPAPRTGR